jgi:hypothetical protein
MGSMWTTATDCATYTTGVPGRHSLLDVLHGLYPLNYKAKCQSVGRLGPYYGLTGLL